MFFFKLLAPVNTALLFANRPAKRAFFAFSPVTAYAELSKRDCERFFNIAEGAITTRIYDGCSGDSISVPLPFLTR
jgi:hypothetical protein